MFGMFVCVAYISISLFFFFVSMQPHILMHRLGMEVDGVREVDACAGIDTLNCANVCLGKNLWVYACLTYLTLFARVCGHRHDGGVWPVACLHVEFLKSRWELYRVSPVRKAAGLYIHSDTGARGVREWDLVLSCRGP